VKERVFPVFCWVTAEELTKIAGFLLELSNEGRVSWGEGTAGLGEPFFEEFKSSFTPITAGVVLILVIGHTCVVCEKRGLSPELEQGQLVLRTGLSPEVRGTGP